MHYIASLCLALLVFIAPFTAAVAADEKASGCAVNADGFAADVKSILGPRYAVSEDMAALKISFGELQNLLLKAGHCSASSRSHDLKVEDRNRNIMEWHSINLWLNRLVGIIDRNTHGDATQSWRDEYALFAEVYEFEP